MKKFKVFAFITAIVLIIPFITACDKKVEQKIETEEGTVTFTTKESAECKASTDKDDFRHSAQDGIMICKDYKIGVEFNDWYDYYFDSDSKKLLEKRKEDHKDAKEVTYNGKKAVQFFYGGYNGYDLQFPVDENKNYYIIISVYGIKDTEEAGKAAFNNKDVQDILNSITFSIKEKK